MAIIRKDLLSFFTFDSFNEYGLVHGMFMRHGGCSPEPWKSLNMATSVGDSQENVIENRNRISKALNIKKDSFYDVWQVHSSYVVYTDRPRKQGEHHIQADAIITDKIDVSLLMLFADCVPILLFDPRKKVVACAHAGWQGTFKKVAAETVKSMVETFRCDPQDILAAIGPSICEEHYEVGEEVVRAAEKCFRNYDKVVSSRNGKFHINLQKANHIILQNAGIKQIQIADICTMCNYQDWFSHRAGNGKSGRFAAVITLLKR